MTGFFASSTVQKERPVGLVAKCGACGLYKHCQSPKMPIYGEGKKRVLVIGEAPGEMEDEQGRPFIGKAGQFLRDTLEQIDVDLDVDAWTTNSIICHPEGNKTPDTKQIGYCRPNILNAIHKLKPRVVVLLGRSAVASLMPMHWHDDVGTLERWAGWQIPAPEYWICPTYHPSFLLRSHNTLMDRAFKDHLEKAFSIEKDVESLAVRASKLEYVDRSQIKLIYEPGEIATYIELFGEWVAVDYETNCLKPEYPNARIYSCALSDGEHTISFPWSREAQDYMGEWFHSKRHRKIASNLKFEERWTRKTYGHGVRNWGWDTMLAAHCLDNRPGICSLKFQSWVHLGVPSYNENIAPYLDSTNGHYNSIEKIALDDLLFYGALDSLLEHRLAMKQRKVMGCR